LIVDEAQTLPDNLLEELRLLANIESDTEKFLPLVLAGQPELAERLNAPKLRQLKQRIGLRCRLHPLSLHETACYVAARIRLAGGDPGRVFTRDAIIAVHASSSGVPRVINVLCNNALLAGFAVDQRPVDAEIVREVCRDFDLLAGGEPEAPVPSRAAAWAPLRPRVVVP
jgi:general secretion pathway protein A